MAAVSGPSEPWTAFSPTLVAKVRELGSLASDDYVTVFAATRALKDAKRHREVELHLPLS